jgi:hypothetical protein
MGNKREEEGNCTDRITTTVLPIHTEDYLHVQGATYTRVYTTDDITASIPSHIDTYSYLYLQGPAGRNSGSGKLC